MKTKKTYTSIFFALALFLGLSFAAHANAATMSFQTSGTLVHLQQEVAVDVMLDPEGEDINTVSATIAFPDNLTFIGSDDSASVVGLWVDQPSFSTDLRTFTFSGITPGGFSGLIDPFNSKTRKPGILIRLLFKGRAPGLAHFSFTDAKAYQNDGVATETAVATSPLSLVVDNLLGQATVDVPDMEPPLPFTPLLERNLLLYGGKYTVIFNTKDKESGIAYYEVKEGQGAWIVATSPYVLKDQSVANDILIKAVDRAGNERIEVVQALHGWAKWKWQIISSLIGLLAIVFVIVLLARRVVHNHIKERSKEILKNRKK